MIGWPLGHSPRARSSAACSSMRSAICSLAWSLMLLPSCGVSAAPGRHNVVPRRPPWNRGSPNRRLLPLCCLPPSSVLRLFLGLVFRFWCGCLCVADGGCCCAGAGADDGELVAEGAAVSVSLRCARAGGWGFGFFGLVEADARLMSSRRHAAPRGRVRLTGSSRFPRHPRTDAPTCSGVSIQGGAQNALGTRARDASRRFS